MLNCIAIDDEPLALQLLADNISKVPYLQLVASCNDAFEATRVLQEHNIDLIFIDIQMPGLTGLQFIESLARKPMVILITAYKQYALEGYHLDVVDYLVKPVPLDRFIRACNKAQELQQLRTAAARIPSGPAAEYMFVNVGYSLLKVIFTDIEWIEGLKDYLQIHLKSTPKPVIVRMSFKAIEEQLPPGMFVRIHKSWIVSVSSITAIRKSGVFIREHEFPVGDTYKDVIDKLARGN
ncbi:MAG TPA: response regulator transcription factor [Chitinophagaceae bacterium]|nr:response regulator transcription factor [Chitinophagaceae bacterium]